MYYSQSLKHQIDKYAQTITRSPEGAECLVKYPGDKVKISGVMMPITDEYTGDSQLLGARALAAPKSLRLNVCVLLVYLANESADEREKIYSV